MPHFCILKHHQHDENQDRKTQKIRAIDRVDFGTCSVILFDPELALDISALVDIHEHYQICCIKARSSDGSLP